MVGLRRKEKDDKSKLVVFLVRMTGLEPVRPWATSTSSWPVYQFQHIRIFSLLIIGENISLVKREFRQSQLPFGLIGYGSDNFTEHGYVQKNMIKWTKYKFEFDGGSRNETINI